MTEKNRAAQELGRLGVLKGAKARAEKMTLEARVGSVRKASKARWEKKQREEEPS